MHRLPGLALSPSYVIGEVHEWNVADADDARETSKFWQWLDEYEEGYARVEITVTLASLEQMPCQCYVLQDKARLTEMAESMTKDNNMYFHVADGDWQAAGGLRQVGDY